MSQHYFYVREVTWSHERKPESKCPQDTTQDAESSSMEDINTPRTQTDLPFRHFRVMLLHSAE